MNERLKNSIEVLQRAYLEETLEAGDCEACAVGNLVAASSYEGQSLDWRFIFCTIDGKQSIYDFENPWSEESAEFYRKGLDAIKSTGYSVEELARIEYAFESSLSRHDEEVMPVHESQWIRLQAVLKVLFKIEGIEYNQEVEQPFLEKALS